MFKEFTLNISSEIITVARPLVMAIFNATPDSFYAGSRYAGDVAREEVLEKMAEEGADIIDIGGCSTRPGSAPVSADEEWTRVADVIKTARRLLPEMLLSIDTFNASTARKAVEAGVNIVNDISAGAMDAGMIDTVAELKTPYIIMHTRGTPETMTALTDYPEGVATDVIITLSKRLRELRLRGIADIIVDPGFGFAKTVEQNFELLRALPTLSEALEAPMLVGMSRKSMLTRLLDVTSEEALSATTAVNVQALLSRAAIIRVHDVKEGVEARKLAQAIACG